MLCVWNLGQVGPQDVPVIYSFCSQVGCLQGYENKGPHRASLFRIKKYGQGSEAKTWNDEKNIASKENKSEKWSETRQANNQTCDVDSVLVIELFCSFCFFLCLRTCIFSVCGVYDFIIPGAYWSYVYCFQVAVPTRTYEDKCLPNVSTDLRRIICIYIYKDIKLLRVV